MTSNPAQHPRSAPLAWIPAQVAPVVLALTFGLIGPARADLVADTVAPAFSKDDLERIERNTTLKAAVGKVPWSVYETLRVLDAGTRMRTTPADRAPKDAFDPTTDPDLNTFQRAAPEAAHDLFQLIKKAGGKAK